MRLTVILLVLAAPVTLAACVAAGYRASAARGDLENDRTVQPSDRAVGRPQGAGHDLDAAASRTVERGSVLQGVGSCAAAACHGSPRTAATSVSASSYTVWMGHDPHARAYATLYDARSQRIADALDDGDLRAGAAHELPLCLACHSMQSKGATAQLSLGLLHDGVGCESCHGASEHWRTEHYHDGWKWLPQTDWRKRGFVDLKDLRLRAETCVACHVGEPGREVDHRLIAAGHPPLRFEFGAYHDALPKHWTPKVEARAGFAAKAWSVGQPVAARAAVKLLQGRILASGGGESPPGPQGTVRLELAEYNCTSCHHDLRYHPPGSARVSRGRLQWGAWYLSMPRLLSESGSPPSNRGDDPLSELVRLMSDPSPAASDVRRAADRAIERLSVATHPDPDALLARLLKFAQAELRATASREASVQSMGEPVFASWEGAAQWYLAIAAAVRSRRAAPDAGRPLPDGDVAAALAELRAALAIPKGYDSPRDFDPDRVRNIVERIVTLLTEHTSPD